MQTDIVKAKEKLNLMKLNQMQSSELLKLVEIIVNTADDDNSEVIYNDIKKTTIKLINDKIFTFNDIQKLKTINNLQEIKTSTHKNVQATKYNSDNKIDNVAKILCDEVITKACSKLIEQEQIQLAKCANIKTNLITCNLDKIPFDEEHNVDSDDGYDTDISIEI